MKILRLLAAAFVVSAGFSSAAVAQARLQLIDPPSPVRAAPDAAEKSGVEKERGQVRARDAHPNWDSLNQLRKLLRANPSVAVEIELPVFEDTTLLLSIDRMEVQGHGVTSFSGHVVGEPLNSALIVDARGTFAVHVNRDNKAYQITFRGSAHTAAEIDKSVFDGPDEPRVPRKVKPAGAKAAAEVSAAADDGSTIDVMVVYSPLARATAGGTAAIQNQIDLALASTNQAYAASGMVQRARLVHMAEVNYIEPASYDIGTTLDMITNGVAPFDGVNALRTQYGADVVSMFVERGGAYCGIGWLMHEIGAWFAPNAYNVTVRTCATTGSTLSHEMGHNMGLEHDLYVSPEGPDHPVAQRYAHGYVNTAARFRTVMAYQSECSAAGVSCVRLNSFSSPNYLYNGALTGNATTANAARMLNESRVTVANFRAATVATTPSTISFALAALSATEGGPALSAVVTRTGNSAAAASVTWTTANGTALAGQDFGIAGNSAQRTGVISWLAGESGSKTLPLAVLDDTTIEPTESFTIQLTSPAGAVLGTIASTTVTVVDNDSAFNVGVPTIAVGENGTNVLLNVTRNGSLAAAANVTFRTSNGTAIAGTDFGTAGSLTQPAGVLAFTAGQAARQIIIGPVSAAGSYIRVINDALVEADKTFTVTLSAPTGGAVVGAASSTVVTITSDDVPAPPPAPGPNTLTFATSVATVAEGTPNLLLSVRRSGALAGTAAVTWSAANGAAVAGTDFGIAGNSTPPSGTLSWGADDGLAKTITIPIIDDTIVEGAKTFTVALSSPVGTGVAIGAIPSVAVTLTDNDAGVVLGAPTYSVGEAVRSATFTVQRVGSAALAASVRWATANGTATAGQDFGTIGSSVQPSGVVSWLAGDATAKSFLVPLINDTLSEGSETFTVSLNTPSAGITIGTPASATVTIIDDDSPPATELRFAQPKYVVIEGGGNAVLTVARVDVGGGFGMSANVRYATLAGTALATSDFTAVSGTLAWATGDSSPKTITVPIVNDAIAESPESFKVQLTAPSAGTGVGTPEATVTILDDDEVFPLDGVIPEGWVTPAGAQGGWFVSNDPGPYDGAYSLK
ncbi:MAG: Calx-beta domain-containing protein, partial [Usitatibacter sp.]